MILTWYGHSCFHVETSDGVRILIDPFLNDNPVSPVRAEDVSVDYVIITHGHNDHVGDALSISIRCNAPIIAIVEIADFFETLGAPTIGLNLGGKTVLPFGTVKLTPALHSSSYTYKGASIPMGLACGVVIDDMSTRLYHAGDTAFFSDMQYLGSFDIALLPIGDFYTMGIDDAVMAASCIQAATFIPMHYNTFDAIIQNPYLFINRLEDSNGFVPEIGQPFNESCVYL